LLLVGAQAQRDVRNCKALFAVEFSFFSLIPKSFDEELIYSV
jgi:hypothetical protein